MNNLNFSLGVLESILEEVKREDMTFAERAGLYSAAKLVCEEFRRFIDEERGGHGYAHEKVSQYQWHVGAALGFDITNGHEKSQHISWTLGAFWTLRDVLTEAGANSE